MYHNKFIVLIILLSIFLVGCDMEELNNKGENTSEFINIDIGQLVGVNYKDIEKMYGYPFKAIFYINKDDFNIKTINNITIRDFYHNSLVEASYKNSSDFNSYINLSYNHGKVIDATYNNIDVINYTKILEEDKLIDCDYKIELFKEFDYILSNKFNLYLCQRNLIGKNITYFNKEYNIECANYIASDIKSCKKFYFYPLIKNDSEDYINMILIYTINDKIKNIDIIDKKIVCELIIKDFLNTKKYMH